MDFLRIYVSKFMYCFRAALMVTSWNFYDYEIGDKTFLMNGVECDGSESSIGQCSHTQRKCKYDSWIAGVVCASNGETLSFVLF